MVNVDPNQSIFDHTFLLGLQLPSVIHPVWTFPDTVQKEKVLAETIRLNQLETLDNWRRFWNTLATYPLLRVQSNPLEGSVQNQNESRNYSVLVTRADNTNPSSNTYATFSSANLVTTGVTTIEFLFPEFLGQPRSIQLRPPLSTVPIQINTDDLVLAVTIGTDRESKGPFDIFFDELHSFFPKLERAASFEDTFPNLTKLGPDFRSLALKDMDRILEEEGKRSKAELDVFGAKIPSELITIVGLPVLWLLLLQFISICRYIRANADSISTDAASKYPSILKGFIVFTVLIVFLPGAVSFASMFFVPPKDLLTRIFMWTLVVLITVACCCELWHLHGIKKMVRPPEETPKAKSWIF